MSTFPSIYMEENLPLPKFVQVYENAKGRCAIN